MRLSLASLIRLFAGLIHPDVLSPLRIMDQALTFLQHEMSKEDFSLEVSRDMFEDDVPFRKHLSRLESEQHNLKALKEKVAPEMGEKASLFDEAEKLSKKILDDFEVMLKDSEELDKMLGPLNKAIDDLDAKLREITSILVPKLERLSEPELESFKTRAEKPAPQKSLFQRVFKRAKNLLIDDLWDPEKLGGIQVARTWNDAVQKLNEGGWDTVYLDNDLGPGQKEGWEILNWMMRDLADNLWPRAFVVFSSNNQARPRMESKLRAMGYTLAEKDSHGHPVWTKA